MGIVIDVTADHPLNAPLLTMLRKQGVKGSGDAYDLDGWQLHTHPDLCDHLQSLNRACYRGDFGVPVLANARGLHFAVARGTSFLAFRLPEPERSEAKAAGESENFTYWTAMVRVGSVPRRSGTTAFFSPPATR